ncbi:MAG TPA: hypothetical protein VN851_04725 [Thermoanaerobaculia bacterium]|nr:hypothetical protein [Thermoanaerobaculia bacterium]
MRRIGLAAVSLALMLWGCGGGSSPSEPRQTPPVSLAGTWSGTVALTTPNRVNCTISFAVVQDGQDFFGDWEGRCPDTQGSGVVVVSPLISNLVLVTALQGEPVFGGCGWSSFVTREGNRLRGDFNTPQNCPGGPALAGQLDLTKR